MTKSVRLAALALSASLLLAACGGAQEKAAPAPGEEDGAVSSALGDQIMVDPDLAGQNQANSAVSAGQGDTALPPELRSPAAIARARAEALALVGGSGKMRRAPEAIEVNSNSPTEATLTAAARAAAAPGGNVNCAEKAEYTMQWAARLPEDFPVYPQGAVQEAAGTDQDGCSLRVVNYVTPVPLNDVVDFYFTRAGAGGFTAKRVREGGDDVLGGVKGKSSFVVYARKLPAGGTEVDLITSGK